MNLAEQLNLGWPAALPPCPRCGGEDPACARCALERVVDAERSARPLRVGLVGCGKEKNEGVWPARALYTGRLSRWSLDDAAQSCDVVYVLSGKHHLLELDEKVEKYHQEVPRRRPEREAWAREAVRQLEARYGRRSIHVVIYAGWKYATVAQFLPAHWTCEQPMQGLEVGERLHWLKVRRRSAERGRGMHRVQDKNVAHFTVVQAAQIRAGDEIERVLGDRGAQRVVQVSEVRCEGSEIVVRTVADGRRGERRLDPRTPVALRGRQGLGRGLLGEAPALSRQTGRREVEAAVAAWAARAVPHLSPGHRASLAEFMVAARDGVVRPVTPAAVGEALLAAGGGDGPFLQRLEAAGVAEGTRRAFDSFWLRQADAELAGGATQMPPLWTVPLPSSPRLVVVTERAVDVLAYAQAEVKGASSVFVAVGGPLEGDRATAVQSVLAAVQSLDGGTGMAPVLVAAFGAGMDGTVQAKALRALRPSGMAFDRHAPTRGRWGDAFSRQRTVTHGRSPSPRL